ncbi:zinc finger-containing ubiquitin peptidase 1 isoform X1 [Solea solea]|uniref:zinc finger-containing ubiquitin peptidase 1 isoform X1 n=1 Tax=Solea solea TaxID=90069 RepID=UPI00272A5E5E|nr:zinc finger-containing ubiquitin peptidase 1 isoform X1 [Solea solea]XP_058503582.1 zinc finger-containing ubiquitin peptidase 1 isoform X1 [Solea solea]XP_058503583.1 zinc finger-containing ubiquitin peptidase 1 isoform X1 [Solea solea]XP_058503584.1 zinc finger-containing ubiquitin peptidase 1 isoform X1 [Solea solea]
MLTCEICGEDILLEEDMKTHLLLDHMENNMHCPLCSLSGVSYDELCFHISSAHPEKQQATQFAAQAASTNTGLTPQSCDAASEVTRAGASGVTTDSVQLKHNSVPEGGRLSLEDTGPLISTTETRQESFCERSQSSRALDRSESVSHCNGSECDEPGHSKAKQKCLSSSRKDRLFSCPMCALVFCSSVLLQEHVELHLEERSPAEGETGPECPMCSVVCSDDISLQEHVELHLDHDAAGTGSPGSDLKLARQLQQQEEEIRRRQEEAQEEKEFKKLQRQFGVDGSGGYRRQMERTMERAVASGLMAPSEFHCKRAEMMESLASGVDDGRTRTRGVVRALYEYYQTECRDCAHVWLSADTDHYCSSEGDKGWGCGYRNIQMLLSSLHNIDTFSPVLQDRAVPSIPQVQSMIEEAWKEGLDPQGASHFNQQLQGTRAWIGATEIYCLLTSLGISAHIIDFHQPTGPGDTHPRLFEWIKQYYCQASRGSRLPPRLVQTSLPPIYLQHQGHSRSVVGLEQRKNGSLCLLVLDPGSSVSDTRKLLSGDTIAAAVRHVRKFPSSLKHKQYQVVAVQGVLSAEEKRISILNSRTLCAERIP